MQVMVCVSKDAIRSYGKPPQRYGECSAQQFLGCWVIKNEVLLRANLLEPICFPSRKGSRTSGTVVLNSGLIFHPRGYVAMSGDTSDCHNWAGVVTGGWWGESMETVRHPAGPGQPSKCQSSGAEDPGLAQSWVFTVPPTVSRR